MRSDKKMGPASLLLSLCEELYEKFRSRIPKANFLFLSDLSIFNYGAAQVNPEQVTVWISSFSPPFSLSS